MLGMLFRLFRLMGGLIVGWKGNGAGGVFTVLFYDIFTGANGTKVTDHAADIDAAGTGWVGVVDTGGDADDITIVSNRAKRTAETGGQGDTFVVHDAGVANCTVKGTININNGINATSGFAVRMSDGDNYLLVGAVRTGAFRLLKKDAGSYTQLATAAVTINAATDYAVVIVLDGNSIVATLDGANTLSVSNAFNAGATMHGLALRALDDIADVFEIHTKFVVFDGNSMTDGLYSTYPTKVVATIGWLNVNIGVSGQTTQGMLTRAAAYVDAEYDAVAHSLNVVVAWEGTNDLKLGATAQEAYDNLVTYCQGRRAVGFKVVILTLLPRQDSGLPVDYETSRVTVNTNIRANWSTFSDALADVDDDVRLQDPTNTTYFNADKVHLVAAGDAVVAGIVAPVMESL